jgi:Tfp pilus assembly protein PilX
MNREQFSLFRRRADRRDERGVALIMVLGILSLLLIMAMAFAFTAQNARLISSVHADIVASRVLADSGLARATGFIQTLGDSALSGANANPGAHFYGETTSTNSFYNRPYTA